MYKRNVLRVLMTLVLLSLNLFTTGSTSAFQSEVGGTKAEPQKRDGASMKKGTSKESPFACNVSGLNKEQRQRWMSLIEKLASTKQEVRELEDGYAFRFAAEPAAVQDLIEFITYERLCCPFFDLEVALEREGGPAWLRLRGREGVKEFIRSEFGIR